MGNPLIPFVKKIEVDGPRPDLGLNFREFRGCFKKIEPKTYIILEKFYYGR